MKEGENASHRRAVWVFATIECDWSACTNKTNLHPGPMDIDRE
nr:MAG TPA: hypothetical protein [Caudoviricetes sp.]